MDEIWIALTAIESLWKKDQHIVFLGSWCITQYNKPSIENLSSSIMNEQDFCIDWEKCQDIFQKFIDYHLDELCEKLNELHGETHEKDYWSRALLPWMKIWFQSLLIDYSCLEQAIKKYPGCKIMTYNTNEDEINWRLFELEKFEVEERYKYDLFHVCIYNVILDYLKRRTDLSFEIVCVDNPYKIKKNDIITKNHVSSSSLKESITKKVFANADIYMQNIYVENVKKFLINSRCRVSPMPEFNVYKTKDMEYRTNEIINETDEEDFISFALERFWIDLPVDFLEAYKELRTQVDDYFRHTPRYVMSFNMLVNAMLHEKGSKTIGMTHNVLYALLNCFHGEVPCSTDEFDLYYVWGENKYSNTRICPTFKYALPEKNEYEKENIYWFFSGNEENRYSAPLNTMIGTIKTASSVEGAVEEYILFCKHLKDDLARMIYYRMRDPWGFGMEKTIHEANPLLNKDEAVNETPPQAFGGQISEKLYSSRLIICNSFYTAVLYEALVRNVPVIVIQPDFTEYQYQCFWEDIPPYFAELKKLGIWYTDGKEAAVFLNQHINEIESWWDEPQRQAVISAFANRVCMKTENASRWWKHEIKDLLKHKS